MEQGTLFAFPIPETFQQCGMTLRDYFAAAYVMGAAGKYVDIRNGDGQLAYDALRFADAMMQEREKHDS